jgi:EmrB/QacA subfamily drug resistance transporter
MQAVKRRGLAITVLLVASFMDLVDLTITNTALPVIQKSLGTTESQLEWILSAYALAFAVLLITGGRLGDIFGRKNVFMAGVAGFTLASLACSLATNGDIMVASRLAQGACTGIMVPQVLSCIQVMYKPDERATIYAFLGAIGALASVFGLILGGWMVTADLFGVGWRSIFVINLPVGALLLVMSALFVPNSKAEHPLKLDILGVLLSIAAIFLVEYPLIEGRLAHWAWRIWAMFIAAPIVGAVFIQQQRWKMRRGGSPLLPPPLFANRGFSSGLVVQAMFWMANGSYMMALGYYLQRGLSFTAFHSGLTLIGVTVGAVVVTPLGDFMAKKFGKWVIFLGGILQAGAFAWIIVVIAAHPHGISSWSLIFPLAVVGAGMVMLLVPLLDEALAGVDTSRAGAASGIYITFQQVGYSIGVAVVGVVYFGRAGSNPTPASLHAAVTESLYITVAAFAVAGFAALLLPNHRAQQAAEAAPHGDTELSSVH